MQRQVKIKPVLLPLSSLHFHPFIIHLHHVVQVFGCNATPTSTKYITTTPTRAMSTTHQLCLTRRVEHRAFQHRPPLTWTDTPCGQISFTTTPPTTTPLRLKDREPQGMLPPWSGTGPLMSISARERDASNRGHVLISRAGDRFPEGTSSQTAGLFRGRG